jgi:hypothetical protein
MRSERPPILASRSYPSITRRTGCLGFFSNSLHEEAAVGCPAGCRLRHDRPAGTIKLPAPPGERRLHAVCPH